VSFVLIVFLFFCYLACLAGYYSINIFCCCCWLRPTLLRLHSHWREYTSSLYPCAGYSKHDYVLCSH